MNSTMQARRLESLCAIYMCWAFHQPTGGATVSTVTFGSKWFGPMARHTCLHPGVSGTKLSTDTVRTTAAGLARSAGYSGNFGSDLLGRWNLRRVPSAAQRLDQIDTRHHLLRTKIDCGLLVVQQSGLRGDYIEVRIQATLYRISASRSFARRVDGGRLAARSLATRILRAARLSSTCWNAVSTVSL